MCNDAGFCLLVNTDVDQTSCFLKRLALHLVTAFDCAQSDMETCFDGCFLNACRLKFESALLNKKQ